MAIFISSKKHLSVAHWNVNGAHDSTFGCKFQSNDFIKSLTSYDINILELARAVRKNEGFVFLVLIE